MDVGALDHGSRRPLTTHLCAYCWEAYGVAFVLANPSCLGRGAAVLPVAAPGCAALPSHRERAQTHHERAGELRSCLPLDVQHCHHTGSAHGPIMIGQGSCGLACPWMCSTAITQGARTDPRRLHAHAVCPYPQSRPPPHHTAPPSKQLAPELITPLCVSVQQYRHHDHAR